MEIGNLSVINVLLSKGLLSSVQDRLEFYNLAPTSSVKYMLEFMMQTQIIPANEALVYYSSRLVSNDHLLAMGLTLRNGADPNVYVEQVGVVGSRHILAYLLSVEQSRPDLVAIAVEMLMLAGSRKDLPVFHSGGRISITDWVISQNLDPDHILDSVPSRNAMLIMGMYREPLTEEEATTIIIARTTSVPGIIDYFPKPVKTVGVDCELIYTAIIELDFVAFTHYLTHCEISYAMINVLLLRLLTYRSVRPLFEVLGYMLLSVIQAGRNLDSFQKTIVSSAGEDILTAVNTQQSVPKWKRYCNQVKDTHQKPSETIKRILDAIGVEDTENMGNLCSVIEHIFLSNPEQLRESLRKKQKLTVLSRYGYPSEILEVAELPVGNFPNAYDYASEYVIFYRDSSSVVWAWDSRFYETLLDSKVNLETGNPLPESILKEIEEKRDTIIKREGNLDEPRTVSDIVQFVDQDVTYEQRNVIPARTLQRIMCEVTCIYQLDELTDEHATRTFELILREMRDESQRDTLFSLYRLNTTG